MAEREESEKQVNQSEMPRPTPTNEEVASAAYYPPRASKDVGFHMDHDPPPDVEWSRLRARARAEKIEKGEEDEKQKSIVDLEKNKSMAPETGKKGYKTK